MQEKIYKNKFKALFRDRKDSSEVKAMNEVSGCDIFPNFALKNLTSFKIGGKCELFCVPHNVHGLRNFLRNKPGDIPTMFLGHMSNILISDEDIQASIICTRGTFQDIQFMPNGTVQVGSGVSINKLTHACAEQGISCLEKLYCIPGTIGGALSTNAGTPDFEICESVISVECMDPRGNIVVLRRNEIGFEYRKGNIPKNLIIISCVLKAFQSSTASLNEKMKEIRRKRLATQPINAASCGSTFKNPEGYKAWQLIDSAGGKGMSVGGASISDLHCNFIINNGEATFLDVTILIRLIKEKVLRKHGIMLEEEVQIIELLCTKSLIC